ncbi:MAG TPA: molybdopterin-dependent oxidoreductase [Pyrinomonadaceae bacterium]|nr:molybdopterin-dependent oxidoreductase [Pyrinomonadaceae bacterium]
MNEDKDILVEEIRELRKPTSRGTADILREPRHLSSELTPDEARGKMAAMTRRSFLLGGAAAAFGVLGWRWMSEETKYGLLRKTFELNERVAQTFYSPNRLATEFRRDQITDARTNGDIGMPAEFDATSWKLNVGGTAVSIDEIKAMPRTEMIIEFKCIEGWSTITHFAGVRFSDFAAKFAPNNDRRYVSLVTPDEQYYVGWDIEAIMHPQTLLAYEMNGMPLKPEHGAPLRLASPTKYGIKQIKRIGKIEFTNERPRDYWAEQGYDWYAGL